MRIEHGLEQIVEQLANLALSFPADGRRSPCDRGREEALRSVAVRLKEFSLDGPTLNRQIFSPLADGLVARWGMETGPDLYHRIVNAFRDEGLSVARGRQ